jgi:hypothetical protein
MQYAVNGSRNGLCLLFLLPSSGVSPLSAPGIVDIDEPVQAMEPSTIQLCVDSDAIKNTSAL